MTRKKILHITQATGGVKTYTAHILAYADPHAFEFVVIAPQDGSFQQFCAERAITYYPLNLERDTNVFTNLSLLARIVGIIKKEKPDIIHTHSAKGGFLGRLAARFTSSKVIYTPHAFSYLPFSGIKRTIFFLLELSVKKYTTMLLAISYSEANRAIYELGYKKENVRIILNAIPPAAGNLVRSYSSCTEIRMIGRLTHQKNHFLFLEIASFLSKKYAWLRFAILGAGIHDHQEKDIREYLREHKLEDRVRIEAWGDPLTSKRFLTETDIFVTTSVFEGLPFSLLEAMASGIPCVVSKVDGNTDVIQNNENGFACLSREEFCTKIELLIHDCELRETIGQAGYQYVKTVHNLETNLKQLEAIYYEM
ncbi:glycosyltransferase [Hufsiella ginkgonis]|uniref:Glycosyltransferase n=1 Tax=Hufsiella ginkgonis TaxID=2695274 RepID=A0A7K1Y0T5_9SPHI|nr:glycosyltransferase [Hufsiella ginkgonis]MXV16698.1 glycosyltransferase [Hufsiella ginkgonis]